MPTAGGIDPTEIEALLCDADGCLFPSEEPAFVASAAVTNRFLAEIGAEARFSAEQLRLATTGMNFRTTAAALARREGIAIVPAELERWVEVERREVGLHLGQALSPDPEVREPLARLARGRRLALVSSSASARLEACLEATDLGRLFPPGTRFSAESSLPVPTSKPDPAVYLLAGERLGISAERGLAVEDSVPGAQAAIAAGFATLGNVAFVPVRERPDRIAALEAAGVAGIVFSWAEVEDLLGSRAPARAAADSVSGAR
jgi:beta-phosphoglucomutase-like phosphatase (HAD superfamily)